jgi:hypothetical protein
LYRFILSVVVWAALLSFCLCDVTFYRFLELCLKYCLYIYGKFGEKMRLKSLAFALFAALFSLTSCSVWDDDEGEI